MHRSTTRMLATHVGSLPRPPRPARDAPGEGGGRGGRRGGARRPRRRGRDRGRRAAARPGDRRRQRRRGGQDELPRLRQRPSRRLRAHHGQRPQPVGRVPGGARLPRVLRVRREERGGVRDAHARDRPGHLHRARRDRRRHRPPRGGDGGLGRRGGLHDGDLADERRGLAGERLLRHAGGVPVRDRRGDARGVPGDRRRRLPAADRRPGPADPVRDAPQTGPSTTAARGRACASRR